MVKIDASSSLVIGDCVPGDGDGMAAAWVVNVYVSAWPFVVWAAVANKPPVCDRLMLGGVVPEVAPEGFSSSSSR